MSTEMAKKIIMIGIGGASCSGKSTVSYWLSKLIPNSHIIHQDKFFKHNSEIPLHSSSTPTNPIEDWDCPDSLEMNKFNELLSDLKHQRVSLSESVVGRNRADVGEDDVGVEVREKITRGFERVLEDVFRRDGVNLEIVLVDGFLIYENVETYKHLDYRIFITANFETLNQRRSERYGYLTKSGSTWVDPPGYYETVVWPHYLEYNQIVLKYLSNDHSKCLQADDEVSANGLGAINSDVYIVGEDSGTELNDGSGYFIVASSEGVPIEKTVHDVAAIILKLLTR
ncbi:ribosylnicotinamide kinase [Nowakowskiella sp. JEL0407]|nr:ribosylnicotinamide kinase [Nowakowskiella sp. JEL0407]